jgi:hypothetical protein
MERGVERATAPAQRQGPCGPLGLPHCACASARPGTTKHRPGGVLNVCQGISRRRARIRPVRPVGIINWSLVERAQKAFTAWGRAKASAWHVRSMQLHRAAVQRSRTACARLATTRCKVGARHALEVRIKLRWARLIARTAQLGRTPPPWLQIRIPRVSLASWASTRQCLVPRQRHIATTAVPGRTRHRPG